MATAALHILAGGRTVPTPGLRTSSADGMRRFGLHARSGVAAVKIVRVHRVVAEESLPRALIARAVAGRGPELPALKRQGARPFGKAPPRAARGEETVPQAGQNRVPNKKVLQPLQRA